jgi:hypothetical protein
METVVYRQILPPRPPPASRTPNCEFYQYRHEGEVVKEENRPRMKKYAEDNKALATWILGHVQRFGDQEEPQQLIPAATFIVKSVSTKAKGEAKGKKVIRKNTEFEELTFANSNTIQGCIQFGAHRGKHTILPEYMDYLGGKKEGLDIPDKFSFEGRLEQLTNPWLISFLKSKNVRMGKNIMSTKSQYLTYILEHHTKLEVFTFVKEELAKKGDKAIGAVINDPDSATATAETTED